MGITCSLNEETDGEGSFAMDLKSYLLELDAEVESFHIININQPHPSITARYILGES